MSSVAIVSVDCFTSMFGRRDVGSCEVHVEEMTGGRRGGVRFLRKFDRPTGSAPSCVRVERSVLRPQASRWTESGENAGMQTATYSAPPSSGVL